MTKWILGLLVLSNLALFGWMRWGGLLTEDVDVGTAQVELHPDKIKLLEMLPASSPVSSTTPGLTLTLSVSAPTASASPVSPSSAPIPVPLHVPVVAAAPPKALNCAEWGEFSGDDLSRAQQSLSLLKLGSDLAQRIVERNHGYWVYIPPLKKRANVEKKIAQLKERGVKDYFVVQENGKWLNSISLGVFKTKEAAEKYIDMLRTKDVRTAKLGERISKLKYTVFVIKNLDSGTADKLNALQKEFPDSELKVSACSN